MTLHELFYAYYPDAPRTILFREQSSGCLVSPRLSVLKIPQVDSMIVVKVHVPHGVPRINWDAPTLNPIDASAATMTPLPPASSLMDSQMHHPTGSLQFDQPPPHHASLARSQNPVRVSASEPQVVSSVPTLIPPQLRAPLRDPHQHPQSSHSRFTVDVALQAEQDQQSPTKSIPEKRLRL
ncbi:hypothetical protein GQ54DRAFT_295795 [Martensiomyces pterosporus]|nr:hypothetical protein GQ54DRAFT_295795 [Martensiomyces pterosporus]